MKISRRITVIGIGTAIAAAAVIGTGTALATTSHSAVPSKLCYSASGSVLAVSGNCPSKFKTFEGTVGPRGATGAKGSTGAKGAAGRPGSSIQTSVIPSANVHSCDGQGGVQLIGGVPADGYPDVCNGLPGRPGATGPAGPAGADASMAGAFYAVANYTNGGDGWATVVCIDNTKGDETSSASYVAVSGGVEEDDAPGNTGPAGSSVITSFPGRMDWTTNSPVAGADYGWVVGLSGGDNTPLKVWALCVPVKDFGAGAPQTIVNNY